MELIGPDDLFRLRSPGGDKFVQFCDALIFAQASKSGVAYSNICANTRTNKPDGGVDTQIEIAFNHEISGFLNEKTIWQYKATEANSVEGKSLLEKEVNKPYAKKCLEEGYAYRFCICDDIPPKTVQKWEKTLSALVQKINRNAPDPKVVTTTQIVNWANHFPALLAQFFGGHTDSALTLDAWRKNIIQLTETRKFVEVPVWKTIKNKILNHIDFQQSPKDIDIAIEGEAGVGKTRLTYEALTSSPGTKGMVFYTNDERQAIALATGLANDDRLNAILVADECSISTRVELKSLTEGHKDRIRVIVINNAGERLTAQEPELWIQKLAVSDVVRILRENFQHIPVDRIRAYADLSDGFVRLAADMCKHDDALKDGKIPASITNYYQKLPVNELEVIEALSLVSRIGYKDDVADELNELCEWLGLPDRQKIQQTAVKIHENPGYTAQAGRYFYVTPDIIAQIAFGHAWKRWANADHAGFLRKIPSSLLQVFQKRVSKSASEEVKNLVGDFFRSLMEEFRPEYFSNHDAVEKIVTLTQIDPTFYLPSLRTIVDDASLEQLRANTGDSRYGGRWGSRRSLVWMLEHLLRFHEYFDHCENILLRLSIAESEPGIGNNATGIYKQTFKIFLSGTAVPFDQRLKRLEERILDKNEKVSTLACEVLDDIIDEDASRTAGPTIVVGRIPPEEWRPKTAEQLKMCWDEIVALLSRVTQNDERLSRTTKHIAINHARFLLRMGYLDQLRLMFRPTDTLGEMIATLKLRIQEFLFYECHASQENLPPKQYIGSVQEWLNSFQPANLLERLKSLVGVELWHYSHIGKEDTVRQEMHELASLFYKQQAEFEKALNWLFSAEAKGAGWFGEEFGRLDNSGQFLDTIITVSLKHESIQFARGYIYGILHEYPAHQQKVNDLLDRIEQQNPQHAFHLYMMVPNVTKAVERTFKLIDSGKLSPTFLYGLALDFGRRKLSIDDFTGILERLLTAITSGNGECCQLAIRIVGFQLEDQQDIKSKTLIEHLKVRSLIWDILDKSHEDIGNESYWWGKTLECLLPFDPKRAIKVSLKAFFDEESGIYIQDVVKSILSKLIEKWPDLVMEQLGNALLDEKGGWRFQVGKHTDLLQSIPLNILTHWINSHGNNGALAVAWHLPLPYLGNNGEPTVPPLTEFVFRNFEHNDKVFRQFLAGSHSFQMYSGDIPGQHLKEAEVAKKFLTHPLRRIREWAQYEIKDRTSDASWWQQNHEESDID